jgi:translation initiation factor 1
MNQRRSSDTSLVYSSELGRICPACGKAVKGCVCRKRSAAAAGDGIVRVRRESKGRGGKTVTVITGLILDEEKLKALAGDLKRRCGTGGTIKDGAIEIQGDHRELLVEQLKRLGHTVKLAGG